MQIRPFPIFMLLFSFAICSVTSAQVAQVNKWYQKEQNRTNVNFQRQQQQQKRQAQHQSVQRNEGNTVKKKYFDKSAQLGLANPFLVNPLLVNRLQQQRLIQSQPFVAHNRFAPTATGPKFGTDVTANSSPGNSRPIQVSSTHTSKQNNVSERPKVVPLIIKNPYFQPETK